MNRVDASRITRKRVEPQARMIENRSGLTVAIMAREISAVLEYGAPAPLLVGARISCSVFSFVDCCFFYSSVLMDQGKLLHTVTSVVGAP